MKLFFKSKLAWLAIIAIIPMLYYGVPRVINKYRSVTSDHTVQVTDKTGIALLQYLPEDYHQNSDKYPVVIFLHGIIEKGWDTDNRLLLLTTAHRVDKVGPPRLVKDGHDFPFILLSPQLKDSYEIWPSAYVLEVVEWAKQNLRVDEKRIHLTGLSLGGAGVFCIVEDLPHVFASAVPVCASWNTPAEACKVAKENVAFWAFHGRHDPQVHFTATTLMIHALNECSISPGAKVTIYQDLGHNVWDRAYQPGHDLHEKNIYDWMMGIQKTKQGSNHIPVADAGADQAADSLSFEIAGKGSDLENETLSFHWSVLKGPGEVRFSEQTSAATEVSLSQRGTYCLRLTVTDGNGSCDRDFVNIVAR
jgi:poly(3-hydroxybutyrate) depolymerase